jgi:transcriptional regulator with XRE-family HTH domain
VDERARLNGAPSGFRQNGWVDWPSEDEWKAAITAPDWGERVLAEFRRYFAEGLPTLEPVQLIDASIDVDSDGVPVLLAIYHHAFWPERTGMRRRLDRTPVAGSPGEQSLVEWLVGHIAWLEMGEPLGRQHDLLVEDDNGVWWWGDGYPDITQHPDYGRSQAYLRDLLDERRADDAKDLRNARLANGISVEDLAEASGIDVERLRDAESAKPEIDLSLDEWVRLAVILEGHTWPEYQAQEAKRGRMKWFPLAGAMLKAAREPVESYLSPDNPGDVP